MGQSRHNTFTAIRVRLCIAGLIICSALCFPSGSAGAVLQGPDLVISEFMAVNDTATPTQVEGKTVYPDWIELHNRGAEPVDLAGWSLTDDASDLGKWALPSVRIAGGGYLLVFASGVQEEDHPENRPYRDQAGSYHANFSLSGGGEFLAVVGPGLEVVHQYGRGPDGGAGGRFPPQQADLSYGLYGDEEQYFSEPSPGRANGPGYAGVSAEPVFSHPGGTFVGFFLLELSSPNGQAEIRFTLDGREPGVAAIPYTTPVPVAGTMEVMARAYESGKAPSAVVSRTYVALGGDVLSFSSDLPIVLVDTQRRGVGGGFTRVQSAFIEPGADGRAGILDLAAFAGRGGLKVRGSSTGGAAKRQYAFEIWDEKDQDRDVSLLGLPADSDWILYAPLIFDRALINNALAFELSNQVGRYAVRTRFCEMYLNTNDGVVSASDYVGLYILMEKIKRGPDRVAIEKLEPWDSTEPAITGGYMLKIDRRDPGDSGFRTARGNPTYGDGTLCYVDPKEVEITAAQSAWIRGHLDDFEDALYGPDFADPQRGYAGYIDVASWIDHNLLNMLCMNVDALRLSTFLYKTRDGRIEMGPLWDFDRALDSTDGRDNNPESWHGTGDGTDYHHYVWWDQLFDDANFWQRYIDRWYDLRRGAFSTASINATIDTMADEIREAQVRNFKRWGGYGPRFGSFQGEMDHLKEWLRRRCTWVDGQFVAPPQVFPDGGYVQAPSVVSIVNPHGNGTVYYTVDGSDPRLPEVAATILNSVTLVAEDAAKRVLVPAGSIANTWRSATSFDDSAWSLVSGKPGGVGFERGSGYQAYLSLDLGTQMYASRTSCYIRIPFDVSDDPSELNFMALRMRYDDGFIAYLNGVEIQRALFTGAPIWNSRASGNHDDSAAIRLEEFDVSARVGLLRQGRNLLAIHGLNSSSTSSDLLFSAELVAGQSSSPGGSGASAAARAYAGPITLTESTQVKARVLVAGNPYSRWSGLAQPVFAVGQVAENLRISEIMYHPAETGHPDDPNTEYIELLNIGAETINLNLVKLTEGIDFTFPSIELAGGSYVLVVKDQAAFAGKYDPAGLTIAGQYNGSLNNAGERIGLQDAAGQTIGDFRFRDRWYDVTDGQGFSLTVKSPVTTDPNALSDKSAWRPSAGMGGSPGFDDSGIVPELGAVVISELLANSEAGTSDWIELHNTTDQSIHVGGWFLSDDADDLTRYEIAEGTAIAPGGYVVFYEDRHFGNTDDPGCHDPFALSRDGETVYLHSGAEGLLTGYSEEEKFGASAPDVSLGRYRKSTGAYNFVRLTTPTPGMENADPQVGPIVINEILYHPDDPAEAEYVELLNVSGSAVTLYDAARAAPWRFTDDPDNPGIEFLFPTDEPPVLGPGEYLLLVQDLGAFSSKFSVPAGVQAFEWVSGKLANGSEKVQLSKPGDTDTDGTRTWIRVDRVVYSDGSHPEDFPDGVDPWPIEADGHGPSLSRIVPDAYGNDPANWHATAPSPGLANP